MPAHVVLGLQWGDEGKGKIVDYLAPSYDVVVRFHGGNNAGHTVKVGEETYKFHLVPSGAVAGVPVAIGNGVVVDPRVLIGELDELAKRKIHVSLDLSPRAHVILPYHILLDGAAEEAAGREKIGTTRRGIGPCYADKVARRGVRVADLLSPTRLRARLKELYPTKLKELATWGIPNPPTLDGMVHEYAAYGKRLAPHVRDVGERLEELLARDARVLLEGAQGVLLDIDHGTYPYVTSSSAAAGYASAGAGIAAHRVGPVLGVTKAYSTRVGSGPFPTELPSEKGIGKQLLKVGNEFGTVTGRARRVGWLDLVALRYAVRVGGATHMAVMKLDVLSAIPKIRVATGYHIGGRVVKGFPEDPHDLERARPVFKNLAGWKDATEDGALSAPVKKYLGFLETELGIPVAFASFGPGREETIAPAASPFSVSRRAS